MLPIHNSVSVRFFCLLLILSDQDSWTQRARQWSLQVWLMLMRRRRTRLWRLENLMILFFSVVFALECSSEGVEETWENGQGIVHGCWVGVLSVYTWIGVLIGCSCLGLRPKLAIHTCRPLLHTSKPIWGCIGLNPRAQSDRFRFLLINSFLIFFFFR